MKAKLEKNSLKVEIVIALESSSDGFWDDRMEK